MLATPCVDNASTAAPGKESVNSQVNEELQDEGFDLEMEGDFAECLGITMEQRSDGAICVSQRGLIKRMIATAKMGECKPNKTPTLTTAPEVDPEGKHWDQNHWDHAGIFGLLLCVTNDTRPDILLTASQEVAQHVACPKESHP